MTSIKTPYNASVLMAQYVYKQCLLCHSQPSYLNKETSIKHVCSAKSIKMNKHYHIYNKGILCCACHTSIDWLPSPTGIALRNNKCNNSKLQENLIIQHATYYQHPIDKVILRFKSGDMSVLPILVHIIQQIPQPEDCSFDNSVIIPVPTTQHRLITRGFEPLSVLSAYLSHHWQIPVANIIKRVDDVSSQKSLNRQQRMVNLQGAFELNHESTKKLEDRKILLFDDVMTTGSTFKALAETITSHAVSLPNSLPLRGYCLAHVSKV